MVELLHNGQLGERRSSHCKPPLPNPFKSPKSDNINALSREKGVRINKMKDDLIFYQILSTTCNSFKEMYGDQPSGEFLC